MKHRHTQAVCALVTLKPGTVARAREWAAYIAANQEQALQSLAAESVTIESVFLHEAKDEAFLIYYMRSPSIARAQQVARESVAAIEQYHREFKRHAWESVSRLELLLDLQQGGAELQR